MKPILITDQLYEQLETIAEEQGEMIEIMACTLIVLGKRRIDDIDQKQADIKLIEADLELKKAMLESVQDPRRH